LVPLMVTLVPARPLPGVKLVIFGRTLKTAAPRGLVPTGLVTEILPVVAPAGTIALREVAITLVGAPALTPLNCTSVTESRLVPVIVTTVPTGPPAGVKLETVGALSTMKVSALVPVPSTVVTLNLPLKAVVDRESAV